jgi:hypothetical protein
MYGGTRPVRRPTPPAGRGPMNRIVLSTGLAAATLLAVDQIYELRSRLAELDRETRVAPEFVADLERRVDSLNERLELAQRQLETDDRAERLAQRLAVLATRVERADCEMSEQQAKLASWETLWNGYAPQLIDGDLEQIRGLVEQRERQLEELDERARRIDSDSRTKLAELEARVAPDVDRMWRELVAPVVQLAGDVTVGSGVLLESTPKADGSGWTTHLLTSWHVVRDIYGSTQRTADPVPVTIYAPDGTTRQERAFMVAYDTTLDVAVLELDFAERIEFGARLASRSRLDEIRIFDPIYAVGCPLGNDPIPTPGEIASTTHVVDGVSYWMLSAPTYIGNSGGGIFDARTHELIGIFSKIYTHGAARSTIVPHMGLATPMPRIYEWMESAGCAHVIRDDAPRVQAASAKQ